MIKHILIISIMLVSFGCAKETPPPEHTIEEMIRDKTKLEEMRAWCDGGEDESRYDMKRCRRHSIAHKFMVNIDRHLHQCRNPIDVKTMTSKKVERTYEQCIDLLVEKKKYASLHMSK